ncbi:MAG: Mur ligase domain-containing protein, partial [Polaromonas sp.]
MMNLQQALAWLPEAQLIGDGQINQIKALRVQTDTRNLKPGDLFVALKGEHFDAHDFLAQAKGCGAVAAIAQHGLQAAGLPGLEVTDTRLALGQLAAGWRS